MSVDLHLRSWFSIQSRHSCGKCVNERVDSHWAMAKVKVTSLRKMGIVTDYEIFCPVYDTKNVGPWMSTCLLYSTLIGYIGYDVTSFKNSHFKVTPQRIVGAPSHYGKCYLVLYAYPERWVYTKCAVCRCTKNVFRPSESKYLLMFTFYSFAPSFAWCK